MARELMDDMVFGQILCDPGYRVDFVVGTTYSVDLETFISLPFSLGFLEEPDEVMKKSTSYIYTAMKVCADNMALFCNFSNMKIPSKDRGIFYALMEDSIFSVNAGGMENPIKNFHPKVWVLKETTHDGSSSRIKVIVMSRNLSSSNDLDVVCVMSGEVGRNDASTASRKKHQPLCDFLAYLNSKLEAVNKAQESKKKKIKRLCDDIQKVQSFDISDSIYDGYDFIPMGIPGYEGNVDLKHISSMNKVLIVSPFLDEETIKSLCNTHNPASRLLVTREESVTEGMLNIIPKENIFTMNPVMTDMGGEDGTCVDLHAKMFFATDYSQTHYQYLGSTNATKNGFARNVEFLVRLKLTPHKYSFESFKEAFLDEKFSRFLRIVPPSEDIQEEYLRTMKIRKYMSMISGGQVSKNEDGTFELIIHSTCKEDEVYNSVSVHPMMCPEHSLSLSHEMHFHSIPLDHLSQFIVMKVDDEEKLVKVQVEMPEGRDKVFFKSMMKVPRDLMECISFLLSENKAAFMVQKKTFESQMRACYKAGDLSIPGLYENLLKTSYERPRVLDDIRKLMDSVPEDIIDKHFKHFNTVFNSLVKSTKIARQ